MTCAFRRLDAEDYIRMSVEICMPEKILHKLGKDCPSSKVSLLIMGKSLTLTDTLFWHVGGACSKEGANL